MRHAEAMSAPRGEQRTRPPVKEQNCGIGDRNGVPLDRGPHAVRSTEDEHVVARIDADTSDRAEQLTLGRNGPAAHDAISEWPRARLSISDQRTRAVVRPNGL